MGSPLPSSHSSTGTPLTTPSPQYSSKHVALHPSPPTWSPSSHSSTPRQMKPSPQVASRQATQASVWIMLPSSHSSPAPTRPSPQYSRVQLASQPSTDVRM